MGAALVLRPVIHLATFARATKGWMDDEDLRALDVTLAANPDQGDVMPGTGGLRKVRVALGRRGKSGGARVIYYYRSTKGRVYLITAYRKNEQANLTQAQRNTMRHLTTALDNES